MEDLTALAITTFTPAGQPLAGVICYLKSPSLPGGFLFAITNEKGYARWDAVELPFTGTLELAGAARWYGDPDTGQAVEVPDAVNVTLRCGDPGGNPQDLHLPAVSPFRKPFIPAPRVWAANFCGVRVGGLPPVPGGADDPALVLSWFYDRYTPENRAKIRAAWQARGYSHVVLSWPDSRAFGQSPEQFGATCEELIAAGFYPCVFLCSKDFDPHGDVQGILANIAPVLPFIIGRVPLVCIGWELGIDGWLSAADIQDLTDALAPQFTAYGCRVYVHFQSGYSHFAQNGGYFADYWNLNVGKLTGVLRQRILSQTQEEYRYDSGGIIDVLQRFAGNFGVAPDSGFGHPFDDVELEITAQLQFYGVCSEAEGDTWGQWAMDTPAQTGPAGSVSVMGSGNGWAR